MPFNSARIPVSLGLGVLLAALTVWPIPAQQQGTAPPGPPQTQGSTAPRETQPTQPPRIKTEVNYVRVDVYPTKDGVPVQDLRMEHFEILEDGDRQTIQAFEHVVISPAGPQSLRAEPDSVRSGEQMAANPRNRVFVFFLDSSHVAPESGHRVNEPIIRLMDRILGPDDLVAVMTAEMSATQLTFGRKTEVIADMLGDRWHWGQRHSLMPHSEKELLYEACYPQPDQEALVGEMRARRRERVVLDALHDLTRYLGSIREERKAILTVSEGWTLFRPNPDLLRPRRSDSMPGGEPVGVDRWGKLKVGGERDRSGNPASQTSCDRERMFLANIDNEQHFRDLLDVANRNNASFYPIDPRGLAVFDYPIGPAPPPSLTVDMASLKERIEGMRTLAENTDGIAVVNSNDLERGLRRIADDLTSYYLLGYYSSNTRLDGRFRKITVRVKRPGVSVRARRGYRAATAEEVSASRAAEAAPVPDSVRTAQAAVASLARVGAEQPFAINAVPVRGSNAAIRALWVAGEVQSSVRELGGGATATIAVSGGATVTATASLDPGQRTFLVRVPVENVSSTIDVRARLGAEALTTPMSDAARVEPEKAAPRALLFRRGPSTSHRVQPAANFRFSRTERARLELPLPEGAAAGSARLLDRNGEPLQVPVQIAEKTDSDGQRWLTADAAMAPLGAGEYVVEMTYTSGGTEQRVLTAIRVMR